MGLNIECMVRLNLNWKTPIEATLVAFVPSAIGVRKRPVAGSADGIDAINTDAVVMLKSFDAGKLYQVPIECVQVRDWKSAGKGE